MEVWYIVLHYNKLKGCKKGENRMGRDGTKRFALYLGGSPDLLLLRRSAGWMVAVRKRPEECGWRGQGGWMEMRCSGKRRLRSIGVQHIVQSDPDGIGTYSVNEHQLHAAHDRRPSV